MVYCRIQKCGTSSWVNGTLRNIAQHLGIHNFEDQKRKTQFRYFEVKSVKTWKKILAGNPSAIVHVRHPFERLASGISCKIINRTSTTKVV